MPPPIFECSGSCPVIIITCNKIDTQPSPPPPPNHSAPFMEEIHVSGKVVTKLWKGLNPSKALGPDELHPRVLKRTCVCTIGQCLFYSPNNLLTLVKSPRNRHLQIYVPYTRKGIDLLARNYRPVSLTCVPCKLLEHIVCSNIMTHLDGHKLFSDRQHAFRNKHNCETQLITVINDWVKILDKGGQVDTFILDSEKAFETPPPPLMNT